jgi:hypothetical protein
MTLSGTDPASSAGSVPVPPTAPGVVQVHYGAPTWAVIVVGAATFVLAIAVMLTVLYLRHQHH